MEEGWVVAYTTNEMYRAEMLRNMLNDHGIDSVIINKRDSSYVAFGDIEIYVERDHILKAKQLAKAFDP